MLRGKSIISTQCSQLKGFIQVMTLKQLQSFITTSTYFIPKYRFVPERFYCYVFSIQNHILLIIVSHIQLENFISLHIK